MLTTMVLIIAVLLALILLVAATRPATFRIERSAGIGAPPEQIFPLLNDFHRWGEWSPWEKLDPALRRTHSGATNGVGAVYEWEGNKKVGKGRMEITESRPSSRLILKLDFLAPFKAHNMTEFTLSPSGAGTTVTWVMTGPNSYMGKVMSLFMNMDQLIGKDFEAGLANMRAVAEEK
jgi:uncharacterized protein YndB with AHSA1/START domain